MEVFVAAQAPPTVDSPTCQAIVWSKAGGVQPPTPNSSQLRSMASNYFGQPEGLTDSDEDIDSIAVILSQITVCQSIA